MVKLYKRDGRGRLLFREAWVEGTEAVVHEGMVGRKGKHQRQAIARGERAFLAAFTRAAKKAGYAPLEEAEKFWLVVQFAMKSKLGNKRDHWLRDKVCEHLDAELGWRGLGHVDGFDIGNNKLNVFCVVVDEELGVTAAKSCLRAGRLDFAKARVATRGYASDGEYVLKHSSKPAPDFSVV